MRGFLDSPRRRTGLALVVTLFLVAGTSAGIWGLFAADVNGPDAQDRSVAMIVTRLMEDQHLLRQGLDDEISHRGFKTFLEGLDPMKLYFYQSDIDEFSTDRDSLDDMLKSKNVSFAHKVFNRFLKRVDERVLWIDQLLAQTHDFTVDEEMITDRELLRYPRAEDEMKDRWRKRIKYDLLVLKGDKTEGQAALERLTRRYHNFARRMHQYDNQELLEMYLTAITSSYDPHTTYMSPATLDNFRIALGLNLEGIGAQLRDEDGRATIMKIIPGGAADKHGKLKAEDQIVSVGQGDGGEMVDVVNMKLNDVVQLIRGQAGTTVRLGVIPAGESETKIYKITRAKVELTDSAARGEVFEVGQKPDGRPFTVGVIDLPSFYMDMEGARHGDQDFRSTTRDVRVILEGFNTRGVDAVVLDLRRNGGGSLTEAINLTGLFIDQGPVVQVKGTDNRVTPYSDPDPGMAWEGPLVVLTSKFSASASEILAGAIQDYRRGLIVGDSSTHGKGTVQSLLDLGAQLLPGPRSPNLGALKITMQQFYRPNGDSTQKRGVLADIVLPAISDHMDVGEADLDYAIEFESVRRARFLPTDLVNAETVDKLRTASMDRRKTSEEFEKLVAKIDRYREQKAKKSVTLNEEKFFAERARLNADKEEEAELENAANGDNAIQRDFYLEEVLGITLDYLQELKNHKVAKIN